MLVANHRMAQADILVIGSDGNASRRIPLSDDQDPVSLVAIGDKIVVPDVTRFSLTALDHGGNRLGDFGDAQFVAELARVREQAKWFDRAPWMLGGILVLCLGAGIALGVRSGEIGTSRGVPWRSSMRARQRCRQVNRRSRHRTDCRMRHRPMRRAFSKCCLRCAGASQPVWPRRWR